LSTSHQIASDHLPYLRRYARALTGSQSAGDAYVAATLDTIAANREALRGRTLTRVGLYRLFTKIWSSISLNAVPEPLGTGVPARRRLAHITPLPRQAFLLLALEGFSESEAAQILTMSIPELRRQVEICGRELAADIATDVLIIEDEAFIAFDLEALVESLGHHVAGIARTHREALAIARKHRPGLILADIQLADGSSGIDAINDLLEDADVPVIFITAFPERFLTGERPEPAFFITKPYQPATVAAVLSQALFFERTAGRRDAHADIKHRNFSYLLP
jgi:CheY-like chemotaxis protein